MVEALVDPLTDAATDDSLRAIHIRGEGAISARAPTGLPPTAAATAPHRRSGATHSTHAHRVIELRPSIQLPVVCSVRGWAVGLGCNLALAADFTVAADDAVFWEPFVARGFAPDSGSTWLLPRLVGLARAKEMLLLGEKVTEADAADWGLVIHRCVSRPNSTTSPRNC